MTYKPPRQAHWMEVLPLFDGARYVACNKPGCHRVLRAKDKKPLIHKGRAYRA